MYDATRGLPEDVARQLAQKVDQAADGNVQTRFLEVGVGTGRFAVPLAERGRQYIGIDISEKMLSRLEEKLSAASWRKTPLEWGSVGDEDATRKLAVRCFAQEEKQGSMRLLVADMTDIPFFDQSFDAVLAVHVFHLMKDWQKALQEILRVLRSGGVLVRCWEDKWEEDWKPGPGDIRRQWSKIALELGGNTDRPGVGEQVVTAWLQQQGFATEQFGVVEWEREVTPRVMFESVKQRLWTSTMFVPDDIFDASIERLRQWVDEHYGATIDDKYVLPQRFVVSRTRIGR
jgi:ubiquinone/menaquinone biosynthesis C-methylase UbiE